MRKTQSQRGKKYPQVYNAKDLHIGLANNFLAVRLSGCVRQTLSHIISHSERRSRQQKSQRTPTTTATRVRLIDGVSMTAAWLPRFWHSLSPFHTKYLSRMSRWLSITHTHKHARSLTHWSRRGRSRWWARRPLWTGPPWLWSGWRERCAWSVTWWFWSRRTAAASCGRSTVDCLQNWLRNTNKQTKHVILSSLWGGLPWELQKQRKICKLRRSEFA